MKVGILSDTHKRVKRAKKVINLLVENGAEMLLHAGDIVSQEVLEMLAHTNLPYIAVFGNNDHHLLHLEHTYNLVHEPYDFTIEGHTASIMHHPHLVHTQSDIVVYGHTHTFVAKQKKKSLIINPGEACGRNKPISECALLDIKPKTFDVTYFSRTNKTPTWHKAHYSFAKRK